MYKLLFINLLLTLTVLASEVIATVNGKSITKQDVDRFVAKSIPGADYSMMSYEQKQKVINQLIERELYIDVAKKEGIENDPRFPKELEKVKENLMLDMWMKKRLENIKISDNEVWNYYQTHDSKFHRSAMASARHILVSTKDEAREIIRELEMSPNLKEKFIELAKTRSTGPSAKNGGDLGWFPKDQMVPEFSNAAFALRKGEITHTPVQTPFGWHVIYLTDKKPAGKVEFEKVKKSIENSLKLKKFQEDLKVLSEKLKKSAEISVK
ncbi:MAG: peptidylprolyl isomerase [Epsilonproteobacteria bacterium]|nr:peptidylprolyl isomerase [Campylobacterota bacterium]